MSIAPYVLAALVLLAAHLRDVRADRREAAIRAEHEDTTVRWEWERQELLNRIQAPHLIPMPARPAPVDEPDKPEDDEWDLVGTIAAGADA